MARTAQQSIVFEAALASAVSDRNDVISFPAGARRAPRPARRPIRDRRLRPAPLSMRLHDVDAAELTNALISFLDLLTNVPRAATNLPFMNAGIAAESPPRRFHDLAAPTTDWLPRGIAFGL